MHTLTHPVPPTLRQLTADPWLHQRRLDTHRQAWASLLWAHCSFLLGPGVFALQQSVSPGLCKFWQLYGRVNGDLRQEGLWHTQVCSTQRPCPCRRPLLTQTSNTQRPVWLSLCGVSQWTQGFVWALWVSLAGTGFDSTQGLPLLPSCWGFSFALGHEVSSWWDPAFSSWWLFSRELWFWISHRKRWAHVLLLCHLDSYILNIFTVLFQLTTGAK